MGELLAPIIILGIVLAGIIVFREKINEGGIDLKIFIFSIIVAILGNIFGKFEPIGYLIQQISIIFAIMSVIVMVYRLIFKTIQGITIKLILFSIFLFMIFSTLGNDNNILNLGDGFLTCMNIGRTLSIVMILICILVKSFYLIFGKNKNNSLQ